MCAATKKTQTKQNNSETRVTHLKEKMIKGMSIKGNNYQIPSMQVFVLDG